MNVAPFSLAVDPAGADASNVICPQTAVFSKTIDDVKSSDIESTYPSN